MGQEDSDTTLEQLARAAGITPEEARSHRVARLELTPLFVPFREPVREAMASGAGGLGMAIPAEEEWLGGDFVIAKAVSDTGATGLAEVFVWLPESGTTPAEIISIIRAALGRYVLGESPFDVERIARRLDANVARNEVAKGLLDMACWDLMGRVTSRRVCDIAGNVSDDEMPLAALVPLIDAGAMV